LLKNAVKIAILFLFFLQGMPLEAQSRQEKKLQRLEEKMAWKARKDYKKRQKAAIKHRTSIQTENVQERMKLSRKKAEVFNKSKRDPFFKKLFSKKRKKKHRKKRKSR
jgi:hypothetical protein